MASLLSLFHTFKIACFSFLTMQHYPLPRKLSRAGFGGTLPSSAVFSWLNSPDHEGTLWQDLPSALVHVMPTDLPWALKAGDVISVEKLGTLWIMRLACWDHTSGPNSSRLASFFLLHKPLQTVLERLEHLGHRQLHPQPVPELVTALSLQLRPHPFAQTLYLLPALCAGTSCLWLNTSIF